MKRSAALLSGLCLAGCASFVTDYEQRLIRTLPSQRDVTISDTSTYPGRILCGRYTAYTVQGFTTRSSDFVVGDAFVLNRPTADELAVYCSDDPERALRQTLGIGAVDDDWSALVEVRDDMRLIDSGVHDYYRRNYTLPTRLADMLEDEYGVTPDTLIDPWGKPYHYEPGLSGGTTPRYTLVCHGENTLPGDDVSGADISLRHLGLLDHVLGLRGY